MGFAEDLCAESKVFAVKPPEINELSYIAPSLFDAGHIGLFEKEKSGILLRETFREGEGQSHGRIQERPLDGLVTGQSLFVKDPKGLEYVVYDCEICKKSKAQYALF